VVEQTKGEAKLKPAPFDYVRAATLAEVHAVLFAERGEAQVLAGGQTLVPLLSMRLARPRTVIDIMAISELAAVSDDGGRLRVGACVRQADVLARPDLKTKQPLLALTLPWVGHAQTRSRGTICGSVAHADPSAEIPLILAVLGGEVELSSQRRRRRVKAEAFFTGMMSTVRAEDELIEAVLFPTRPPGEGSGFREFGRRHGDFAIVACAALATGRSLRVGIGGVADRAVVRDFVDLEDRAIDEALDTLACDLPARTDLHATASYRRALIRLLGREVIDEARRCRG
jgi:2-furoyl-CoA dehydrogenase FAD binding subunit